MATVRRRRFISGQKLARREMRNAYLLGAAFLITDVVAVAAVLAGWLGTREGFLAVTALGGLMVFLYRDGLSQARRAGQFKSGLRGEERVARELEPLRAAGWLVRHDVPRDRRGNVDHIVCGPGCAFTIETKLRRHTLEHYGQARGHAAWAHDRLGRWVTPVLCLSTRDDPPRERNGVWIMGACHVRAWLEGRPGPPMDAAMAARAFQD